MSLGDTRVLPRWGPAYRQHDLDLGSRLERAKARLETAAGVTGVNAVKLGPDREDVDLRRVDVELDFVG